MMTVSKLRAKCREQTLTAIARIALQASIIHFKTALILLYLPTDGREVGEDEGTKKHYTVGNTA